MMAGQSMSAQLRPMANRACLQTARETPAKSSQSAAGPYAGAGAKGSWRSTETPNCQMKALKNSMLIFLEWKLRLKQTFSSDQN
jgi:hypothetical protein